MDGEEKKRKEKAGGPFYAMRIKFDFIREWATRGWTVSVGAICTSRLMLMLMVNEASSHKEASMIIMIF